MEADRTTPHGLHLVGGLKSMVSSTNSLSQLRNVHKIPPSRIKDNLKISLDPSPYPYPLSLLQGIAL